MGYRIRELDSVGKFSQELTLPPIERVVPMGEIVAVLQEEGVVEQRERKLNMVVVVLLTIMMNLYVYLPIKRVMCKMVQGLRLAWPQEDIALPTDSAICYRRYQLGARPLVALFHRVCQPMATLQTPGAFLFGLRLMAIDSTTEDVPDTPENVAAFGRHHGDRGDSAFPQVHCVYLSECGTHALVDAGVWPAHTSEHIGGLRLLRSIKPDMLVMWDMGLHDYKMIARVQAQGGQVLSRLPAGAKPKKVCTLADGSYLAYIYPSDGRQRRRGEHLLVRIVEYTLTDPALPGYGERHRLLTTLLEDRACPALELVCAYHERWEFELGIDEMDTHQRLAGRTLRSLKPVGVIQELYALLIAHYCIRFLMHEAALTTGEDPDRLSFTNALRILQDAMPEFQMIAVHQLPALYARLLRDIAAERLPARRHRSNPRVVKRKMSKFQRKRPEHYHWPQPTCPFRQAVSISQAVAVSQEVVAI
jgi:hypothetical protein